MGISNARLVDLYKTMLRIRECEEAFVEPIISGEVRCPVHLYSGQEAIATGVCAALENSDYVFGTHRSHGHYLAKGGDLKRLVAEIFCRETGCARGRGGSMHVLAPEVGMLGAAPIVAGTIALALGAALAAATMGDGRVAVAFFGDGAAGEGVLYESMNFASLRRLPLLLACENNFYSTHLPIAECLAHQPIADVAQSMGMDGHVVDGNDVLAVFEAASRAVRSCRAGQGPTFLELQTYRLRGHVGPDDNIQGTRTDIRSADEIRAWRERDPIVTFGRYLEANGVASGEDIERIKRDVAAEVADAVAFARASRFPSREELSQDVFRA